MLQKVVNLRSIEVPCFFSLPLRSSVFKFHQPSCLCMNILENIFFLWWFGWFRSISSRFLAICPDVSVSSQNGIAKSTPKNQNHHEKSIFQNCSRNVPGAFRGCGVPISRWFRPISMWFRAVSPVLAVSTIWGSKQSSQSHQNHHEKMVFHNCSRNVPGTPRFGRILYWITGRPSDLSTT